MNRKRIIIVMLICVVLSVAAQAQTSHWQCDTYAYEYDMAVYYALEENGVAVTDLNNYEVAAFVGDECRGVGEVVTSEITGGQTVTFCYLRIRSNSTSGETITFKVYNRLEDKEFAVENTSLIFQSQGLVGLPSNPLIMAVMFKGDVNGDGVVDAQDASLVLQLVAKKIAPTADGIVYAAADVNGDGKVDAQDASLILQYAAKKISW